MIVMQRLHSTTNRTTTTPATEPEAQSKPQRQRPRWLPSFKRSASFKQQQRLQQEQQQQQQQQHVGSSIPPTSEERTATSKRRRSRRSSAKRKGGRPTSATSAEDVLLAVTSNTALQQQQPTPVTPTPRAEAFGLPEWESPVCLPFAPKGGGGNRMKTSHIKRRGPGGYVLGYRERILKKQSPMVQDDPHHFHHGGEDAKVQDESESSSLWDDDIPREVCFSSSCMMDDEHQPSFDRDLRKTAIYFEGIRGQRDTLDVGVVPLWGHHSGSLEHNNNDDDVLSVEDGDFEEEDQAAQPEVSTRQQLKHYQHHHYAPEPLVHVRAVSVDEDRCPYDQHDHQKQHASARKQTVGASSTMAWQQQQQQQHAMEPDRRSGLLDLSQLSARSIELEEEVQAPRATVTTRASSLARGGGGGYMLERHDVASEDEDDEAQGECIPGYEEEEEDDHDASIRFATMEQEREMIELAIERSIHESSQHSGMESSTDGWGQGSYTSHSYASSSWASSSFLDAPSVASSLATDLVPDVPTATLVQTNYLLKDQDEDSDYDGEDLLRYPIALRSAFTRSNSVPAKELGRSGGMQNHRSKSSPKMPIPNGVRRCEDAASRNNHIMSSRVPSTLQETTTMPRTAPRLAATQDTAVMPTPSSLPSSSSQVNDAARLERLERDMLEEALSRSLQELHEPIGSRFT